MTSREQLDEFRRHNLWGAADVLIDFARTARAKSEDDRATLTRVASIASWVKGFRSTEAALFPSNRLDYAQRLWTVFNNLFSQLSGWNQEAAMLPPTVMSVDNLCDEAINLLSESRWPVIRKGRGARDLTEVVDNYVAISEASLLALDTRLEKVGADLTNIIAAAGGARDLAQDAAKSAKESSDNIEKARLAFNADAAQKLSQLLSRLHNESVARQADLERETLEQRDELLADAERLVEGLRANHETGNELVKQVADQSVGGGYLQLASKEQRAYRLWNGIGIAAVVVAFAYLAIVFWVQAPRDVEGAILKLGISLTLVLFSAYAFREAGKRLRQSIDARYRALDVIALPPFSNDLDDAQRQALRYTMGERLFASAGEAQSPQRRASKESSYNLTMDPTLAKTVLEVVRALTVK